MRQVVFIQRVDSSLPSGFMMPSQQRLKAKYGFGLTEFSFSHHSQPSSLRQKARKRTWENVPSILLTSNSFHRDFSTFPHVFLEILYTFLCFVAFSQSQTIKVKSPWDTCQITKETNYMRF